MRAYCAAFMKATKHIWFCSVRFGIVFNCALIAWQTSARTKLENHTTYSLRAARREFVNDIITIHNNSHQMRSDCSSLQATEHAKKRKKRDDLRLSEHSRNEGIGKNLTE